MADGDVDAKITTTRAFPCNVFDGVDDYVEIPHNDAQLGANLSNGFTISAWINPRSAGEGGATGSGRILDKNGGTNGFYLQMRQDNSKVNFLINNGTKVTETTAAILGSWTHYIITISPAQLANIYKNTILGSLPDVDLIQSISTITNTGVLSIGNIGIGTNFTFDGSIRNVKMWNRVLSTTEITEEYNGQNHTDGLIHHFKLGGDYTDYGSVGVTATNSGSIPQIVDDAVATVIKDQRTIATLSGTHFITKLGNSQICSIAITETI